MSAITSAAKVRPSTLASSAKFRAFVLTYSIVHPITYIACVLLRLPLFTYFPATNRIVWGYEGTSPGQGPNMLWYGWIATTVIVSVFVGLVAIMLPQPVTKKIPQTLVWLLPILAIPIIIYTLMPLLNHR